MILAVAEQAISPREHNATGNNPERLIDCRGSGRNLEREGRTQIEEEG